MSEIHVNCIDLFNVSFNCSHTKMSVTRINEEEQGLPRRTKSFSHATVNFKMSQKVYNSNLLLDIEQ